MLCMWPRGLTRARRMIQRLGYESGLRSLLKGSFGVDHEADRASGVEAATVAWESAQTFAKCRKELEAEAHVVQTPIPVNQNDRMSLRKALEAKWGTKPDKEIPNAMYVAKKFDEIEQNDPVATTLDEVFSMTDACA